MHYDDFNHEQFRHVAATKNLMMRIIYAYCTNKFKDNRITNHHPRISPFSSTILQLGWFRLNCREIFNTHFDMVADHNNCTFVTGGSVMNQPKYVTIGKFSELSGYSKRAVEAKINKGVWADGIHYRRAPDNRILVDIEVFEKWVMALV
tara:strand:+ start:8341 stop:8787 length:447 start_codon:yes stop_codon:yes gene_type:complete